MKFYNIKTERWKIKKKLIYDHHFLETERLYLCICVRFDIHY